MATLIKQWKDGGNLSVTYDGSGDGSAIFSSDEYEGIDREMSVTFKDASESIVVERVVRQEGKRQQFRTKDGLVFRCKDGGRFGVLKPSKNYTELEYIESSGTQYIDTEYNINTATDEVEIVIQGITTANYKWFFGEHDNNARFGVGSGDGTNKRNVAYGATTYKVSDTQIYNTQHTFIANRDGVYLDGVKIANYSSFVSTSTLFLFHLNLNNQPSYMGGARVWNYKHKRNGELIRDFIPVRDLDGVVCLYDKVSEKFFYNQGTDAFIGGPSKNPPIPSCCTLLSYIESSGAQYINTGMLSSAKSRVEVDFSFLSMASGASNNAAIFGGRDSQASKTFTLFKLASATPQYFRFDFNSQKTIGTSETLTWNNESVYRFTYDGVRAESINVTTGEKVTETFSPSTLFTTSPIYLFAVNTKGVTGTYMTGRIYRFFCTDGVNAVDLYPVLDSNKVACMYDAVSGSFFYNQGSGSFIAGYK